MRDFRELKVWEKAHAITLEVYKNTSNFPSEEKFGLTSQLRRSAASIPANIAEGCGRQSQKELYKFMTIAAGSASETEYHLLLARDLGYLSHPQHEELSSLVTETKRMLYAFMNRLKAEG
jgi:four helix bundle protein